MTISQTLKSISASADGTADANASPIPTIAVGIDDGYACTKVALPDGRLISIPSRARIGRCKVSWIRQAEQLIFEYATAGTVYSVGDVEATPTRFDGYASSGLNRAIVQHALQCADLEGSLVNAVSGLPVSAFYRQSGERRVSAINAKQQNLLVATHPRNGAITAEITEHQVLPEALAAWYDYVICDDDGTARLDQERVKQSIAVVDIGGRTTDTVVVRHQGIQHRSSGSSDIGLLDLKQSLSEALERRFDLQMINDHLLNLALDTKHVRLFGHDHDVSQEVRAAEQELIERLQSELRRQLGSAVDLDRVLIVGGGAVALAKHISDWFPNQQIAPRPAFANARGMLKFLLQVSAAEQER